MREQSIRFLTKSDTNRAVCAQKMARILKFRIKKKKKDCTFFVFEKMRLPASDLRLCVAYVNIWCFDAAAYLSLMPHKVYSLIGMSCLELICCHSYDFLRHGIKRCLHSYQTGLSDLNGF